MSHFILLHGFNDPSAGENNIDRAEPYLIDLGHTVDKDKADYGHFSLLWVRFRKHSAVLRILKAIIDALRDGKDVVLVAYSNGANYAIKALRLVFIGDVKLILVHPALKRRTKFPPSVSRAWVAYTRSDFTVRMASYVRWLIPGWGRMGYRGYKGKDTRITNVDYTSVAKGHGGLWKKETVEYFSGELDRMARES